MKVGERIFGNRLIREAESGNTDACLRVLTKSGGEAASTKVNAKHRVTGNTPLHQACLNGHVCTAKLLLDKGAKINANNKKGETPLMCACRNRHVEIATILLSQYYDKDEVGAHINERNNSGWTALHYASSFLARNKKDTSCIDMCYVLLKHGALINGTAHNGNTPLHLAAHKGHVRLVKALMDRGANIEAVNKAGKTPVESCNHGCKPEELTDYHDVLVKKKKELEKQQQQQEKSESSSSLTKAAAAATTTATDSSNTVAAIVQQHQQQHVEQEITMTLIKANFATMVTLMETLEQQSRKEQQLGLQLQRQVTNLQDRIHAAELEKVEVMEESVHLLEETVELRETVDRLQDMPRKKLDALQTQKSKLLVLKNKQQQHKQSTTSPSSAREQPQQDATEATDTTDTTENRDDDDHHHPANVDAIVKKEETKKSKAAINPPPPPPPPPRRPSLYNKNTLKSSNNSKSMHRIPSTKSGII